MSTSNSTGPVLWSIDERAVARVVLNRPDVNNAYDESLIQGLLAALQALGAVARLRAVVITGAGRHFQAGADLKWIDAVRRSSPEENVRVSRATAEAVRQLNSAPVPTVALVQGGCFGGGTGLIAACDVVIAADNAMFSIAEARWGLTAAIIIPQLADAIGARQLRRYGLTGERFSAAEAHRIGLVHEVVPLAELAAAGERMVGHLLENAPAGDRRDQGARPCLGLGPSRRGGIRRPGGEPRGETPVARGGGGIGVIPREARRPLERDVIRFPGDRPVRCSRIYPIQAGEAAGAPQGGIGTVGTGQ